MRKTFWRAAAGVTLAAAIAAGVAVATSAASTGGQSAGAAPSSAPTTTRCYLPITYGALAAVKAGSGHVRDVVPNQYDLATPSTVSGFFTAPRTIKVYFHVLMNGPDTGMDDDATGDIPQQWIADQMTQLNTAYSGGEGGVDTGFRFVLAGTDRTNNPAWFNGLLPGKTEQTMKTTLRKGGYWDLNVYTADLGGGLLGWAYFPTKKAQGKNLVLDGVVIYHESLPGGNADFGTDAVYNEGDTLSHEAGHWLSLYHTFEHGCSGNGDFVDDTPAHIIEFDCNVQDSCPQAGSDPIHDYMNYTDDPCMTQFMAGQTARMQANWDLLRNRAPSVNKIKPSKAAVGTPVTIYGSSFTDASAVSFNGVPATFTVNSDGSISTTVPVGAATGTVSITGPNGTGTSKKPFKVI
jgi:pregnancy-associated plasma protein-A/IPT/TIG domain-containing protein